MAELNQNSQQGQGALNTATGPNAPDFGPVLGYIGIPRKRVLTPDELAVAKATLLAGIRHDDPLSRFYHVKDVLVTATNNGDPGTETIAGQTFITRDANPQWAGTIAGTEADHHNLKKLNYSHGRLDFLRVHQNHIVGTKRPTNEATPRTGMGGIRMSQVYVGDRQPATSEAIAKTSFTMQPVNSVQYNKDIAYISTDDFDYEDVLEGFIDLNLVVTPVAGTPGAFDVKILAGFGGQDMRPLYGTEFANTTAWAPKNGVIGSTLNGNAITVTSVTQTGSGWRVQLSTADSDYPAAGGRIKFAMAAPSVLAAAPINVAGYEAQPEYVAATV